ncbi:MAG: hypothetical protein AAFO70_05775 [Pseudomonadota bacterium]
MKTIIFSIAAAVAFSAPPAKAAVTDGAVEAVIAEARAECATQDDGVLTLEDGAISRADLMREAGKDAIVDFAKLSCSSAPSLYCGTGGCNLVLLTDGKRTDVLAKDWRLLEFGEGTYAQTVVVIAVHAHECGADMTHRCYRALTWSDGEWREAGHR